MFEQLKDKDAFTPAEWAVTECCLEELNNCQILRSIHDAIWTVGDICLIGLSADWLKVLTMYSVVGEDNIFYSLSHCKYLSQNESQWNLFKKTHLNFKAI